MNSTFRNLLPPLDAARLQQTRSMSARDFGKFALAQPDLQGMIAGWERRIAEPFRGITCDGQPLTGLYTLADEGAPTRAMVGAAERLLGGLDDKRRAQVRFAVDGPEWRRWSNPEFLVNDLGLRLEDHEDAVHELVMGVLAASLGARGYEKARDCMRMNKYLGELTDLPRLFNERSYNFLLFGEPSLAEPWGWSLYGHHLCLNCFVVGGQMVISPTFMGAEPNEFDTGPLAGKRLFLDEEGHGLSLMRSLRPELRERATIYRSMKDPAMPEGRWIFGDERHLGGSFQDNRIVPYEGIPVGSFDAEQRERLMTTIASFLVYLPPGPLEARLRQVAAHLNETWWSWIGGHGDDDPFYYRIQSPVVMIEFDHHSGIWLTNESPAKCHIHTVVRTPNGNDYGRDLLRQHYALAHTDRAPGR